jgi:hypothetical protein
VTPRKTQTARYWQQFTVEAADIEQLVISMEQVGQPQSTQALAMAVIQRRCQAEEFVIHTEFQSGTLYQPQTTFQPGEAIVFPRFNLAVGKVVGQRAGHHPRYGDFTVIQVDMGSRYGVREFAAGLQAPHALNAVEGQSLVDSDELAAPAELYESYRDTVSPVLVNALSADDRFINFRDEWYLRQLAAPIHAGHLNIAEAAIEVQDQPLSAEAVLRELRGVELSADIPSAIQEFSLNAALQGDERFDAVGPKGQVLWYLRRLEPPDLGRLPRYLHVPRLAYDVERLDGELRRLLSELDDELTDHAGAALPASTSDAATLVLSYPHRRAGTLPITPKTAPFFPEADQDYVRITIVDWQSGQRMAGWVVSRHKYVAGLGQWYAQRRLPTGAYITLHPADKPLTVGISFRPVREKREWIRGAATQGGRLSFQNMRQLIACEYDEQMIIGEDNPAALDALWASPDEQKKPLLPFLRQVVLDLIKINPQRTVHAKTVYSAINVVRRCPPAAIFHELSIHACFVPMGHGYFTYDATKED